jgi:guanidinopropionase
MPTEMTPEEFARYATQQFNWYGFPTLLGCEVETDPARADIALVGLPWTYNLMERTQYHAPRAVRNRSRSYHRKHREFQVDPFELARIRDFGDVPIATWGLPDQAVLEVEQFYAKLDAGGCAPFTIGGDHGITLPVLRAIAGPRSRRHAPLGMIHFDSHTDTYGPAFGLVCHAGSGFRLGAEEGLIDPKRTVQVGLNGPLASLDQDHFSRDVGYRMIPLVEIHKRGIEATIDEIRRIIGSGPTFLSFDLDVLTLSDAPAVANPEAGGLTINEVFQMFVGFRGLNIVGGDIACFVPHLDPSLVTAIHSNAIMHHVVTLMAEAVAGAARKSEPRAAALSESVG